MPAYPLWKEYGSLRKPTDLSRLDYHARAERLHILGLDVRARAERYNFPLRLFRRHCDVLLGRHLYLPSNHSLQRDRPNWRIES